MKFLQEVTDWTNNIPNHIYLVVDSREKMLGYIKNGTDKLEMFKSPITFDVRKRKFKQVPNTFGYVEPEMIKSVNSWQIRSDSGNVYTLERNGNSLSCSCSGFKFRSKCKHTSEVIKHETAK